MEDSAAVSVVVGAVVSAVVGSVERTVVSRGGEEEELTAEESDAGGGLVEQAAVDTQKRAQKTRTLHFFIGYTSLTCLQYTRPTAKPQPSTWRFLMGCAKYSRHMPDAKLASVLHNSK